MRKKKNSGFKYTSGLTQFRKFTNNVNLSVKFTCHILTLAFIMRTYKPLMMHRFIHTSKFPLRRWFSRGSSKGMCWLLQRFGADYFWWNGQLLFLFIKDTQLLIILFYWTILPMLPFPLSFGGIWRTKNLTDANQMWVSSRAIFFFSKLTDLCITELVSSQYFLACDKI